MLATAHRPRLVGYNPYRHIFPDFLTNVDRYAAARRYWEVVFDRAKVATPFEEPDPEKPQWQNYWRNNPIRDGNPIFTAINRTTNKALRIVQLAPDGADTLFEYSFVKIELRGVRKEVEELVIRCVPGRRTMAKALSLLTCWLRGTITPQEFDDAYEADAYQA